MAGAEEKDDVRTEMDYHLLQPFSYHHKGQPVAAVFVRLKAPTSRHRKECAFLKQAFYRALGDAADGEAAADQQKKKAEITGQDVMDLISMSKAVALEDVLEGARKLFTTGVALVDGEEKLTGPLADEMSMDDLEKMTGEYLAFFTLRSSLRRLNAS